MIEVSGLSRRFRQTLAVDDLSFTVPPGRITGFLGPNGAGKTTTMRLILGLERPTAGRATVNGLPYHALERPLTQVGALLDATAVQGGRRADQHLWWLARSNGISRQRIGPLLEFVGLGDAGRRHVGGFSLGMKQRLGLAAALLGDPEVLLLDEPVNGLDPEGIRWMRDLLKSLAAEGRTVLVSSHLMNEMAVTADHLIVIGRGRLLADAKIGEFVRPGTSLEDVFMEVIGRCEP
ncbi:ABC-2 type transport system ATP-binding protein [Nonomuraea angiospora]|uniref:ABC-2 type transport system ATP-binding protein n=1 Tax=Nonomuraea angiospora TaxID=46172 RepID=A0ABR9M0L3_9ACTN|nr:ABC-2 type transport system ATP-binding protein [Nonomuraea angiospora]